MSTCQCYWQQEITGNVIQEKKIELTRSLQEGGLICSKKNDMTNAPKQKIDTVSKSPPLLKTFFFFHILFFQLHGKANKAFLENGQSVLRPDNIYYVDGTSIGCILYATCMKNVQHRNSLCVYSLKHAITPTIEGFYGIEVKV